MKNILNEIIEYKKIEVEQRKQLCSIDELQQSALYSLPRRSLKANLESEDTSGIIAEFKRRSPSKGIINNNVEVKNIIAAFTQHAAGISVLTDEKFFGGNNEDLQQARQIATVPLLRKEFIIDEYQVHEARSIGADVILLIAACLSPAEVKHFSQVAHSLELEVLLELHDASELNHICDEADMIGINNRNLKTFEVDINHSINLLQQLPKEKPAIAESGLSDVNIIFKLRSAGFKGFLIGENFMKQANPAIAFAGFINQMKAVIT